MKTTTSNSKVCFGIQNISKGGFFVPFFDYDINDFSTVRGELRYIQDKYQLSDIYIFESTSGFNAICLDKVCFNVLKRIYEDCSNICENFVKLGIGRGYMVLRIGEDKILKDIILNNGIYKKSLSHMLALETFYNVIVFREISKFDDKTVLTIHAYRSAKNGFLEVKEL